MILAWFAVAFLCGAIPFSYWVGRFALDKDIRRYGDGNPGATNVFRAGGRGWGIAAALLDGLKGLVPVGLANFAAGLTGLELFIVALAPILGHAFSPFLRLKGGKAVGVTFGVWAGLTIYEAPVVLGLMLFFWYRSVIVSGWAVMFTLISLLGYLVLAHPDPTLLAILVGNLIVLAWKHRADLAQPPGLRMKERKPEWQSRSYS